MGATTAIEWCDATWNPIGGCSIKSPGCIQGYAQGIAASGRLRDHPLYKGVTSPSKAGPVFNGTLTAAADGAAVWQWPLRWRGAKEPVLGAGMPSTIFVGDMSDLFHEDRPRAVQDKVIAGIVYSRHIGLLLTKRPDVMREYFVELRESARWLAWPHPLFGLPNFDPAVATFDRVFARVWGGSSAEDQVRYDERRRDLEATPLPVHFWSFEPLLEPIVAEYLGEWCIVGGESGSKARPMHPDWARDIRDQCAAAGVPFLFKQWGEWHPCEIKDGVGYAMPGHEPFDSWNAPVFDPAARAGWNWRRLGKKRAGRTLDDRTHDAFPQVPG